MRTIITVLKNITDLYFETIIQSLTDGITFICAGTVKAQPASGAVVLSDDLKNPAMEKLDLVRKWSINTYKVNLLSLIFLNVGLLPSSSSVLFFLFLLLVTQQQMCCLLVIIFFFLFPHVASFPLLTTVKTPINFFNYLNSNQWECTCVCKPAVLRSVPGRSCPRSWAGARGPSTRSWRHKLNSSVKTRGSTSVWSSWLKRWPISCHW